MVEDAPWVVSTNVGQSDQHSTLGRANRREFTQHDFAGVSPHALSIEVEQF